MPPGARIRALAQSVRELMERFTGPSAPTPGGTTLRALPSPAQASQPAAAPPSEPVAAAPPQPAAAAAPQPTIAPTAREVASQLAQQATFASADGSSRALTSPQRDALAGALTRYSADQLSTLLKAGVTYHLVDGQHPPASLGWPAGVRGSYDNGSRAIYLAEKDLVPSAIHETAHALDDAGSSGGWSSTDDPAVTQAYRDYLARVSGDPSKDWNASNGGYARNSLQEFTAEAARAILESDTSRAKIASLDPESYQAVSRLLQLEA